MADACMLVAFVCMLVADVCMLVTQRTAPQRLMLVAIDILRRCPALLHTGTLFTDHFGVYVNILVPAERLPAPPWVILQRIKSFTTSHPFLFLPSQASVIL